MKQIINTIKNRYSIETPLRYYDIFQCLHELFQKQACIYPDHPAIIDGDSTLSYRELNDEADSIACAIKQKGIEPGAFLGLCTNRSAQAVCGILGILKAGCAWVPIDPAYPAERLSHIIADADLSLMLTQRRLMETLSCCSPSLLLFMDGEPPDLSSSAPLSPPVTTSSGETAYVIYTSGTTGKPKGVCCHHQGVVNLLDDFQQRRTLGSDDRCSWWTTLSFDVSVYEIFSPLLAGATLLIVPDPVRIDSSAYMDWLHAHHVTSAYLPPMMVADFVEWVKRHPDKSHLRRVLTGVEPIPAKLLLNLQRSLPTLTIINGYGPTETAICATLYTLDPEKLHHETVPIGKAVQNMHVTLLDENDNPVTEAQTGELYIGGIGVSRGYLNRPELNEELFVPDPAHREEGCRMYRTGDLAYRLPDGELIFAGRRDRQFKYMGYRIEPGEIEAVLKRHEAVSEAIVMLREDEPGLKRLVAYCVADRSGSISPLDLHSLAAASLPASMIPSAFVFLQKIPMTAHGKTDRKVLPPPTRSDYLQQESTRFTAPESPLEQELASVFSSILGMETIGIDDNFFSFGGHSLLATRLCSQIRKRWNVDIPLVFVFEHPTVKQIAKEIAGKNQSVEPTYAIMPSEPDRTVFPASLIQKGVWLLLQYQKEGTLFNIPVVAHVSGPLQPVQLTKAVDLLFERHATLRSVFEIENDELVQRVLPTMSVTMTIQDLSDCHQDKQTSELENIRKAEGRHQFDLETGPLVKLHLVILGTHEFRFFLTFHHLIIDGWGASVFFRELATAYEALTGGNIPVLPDIKISYGDFSLWQLERVKEKQLDHQIQYWLDRLQGASFEQHLPYDFSRTSTPSFSGARKTFSLDAETANAVNDFCLRNSCSLFMYLMTAFQILIHRYTGRHDIVTGTTIANRNHPDTEHLVGFMANSLAIRTGFTGEPHFKELLMQVRKVSLEAFEHQDVPFETVVERMVQQHERGHHPVFQNLFILQNTPEAHFHAGDIDFTYKEVGNETAKIDLLLNIEIRNGSLDCWIEYNTSLFHGDTIERIAKDYLWIVSHAFLDASNPVSAWKLPSVPEIACHAGNEKPLEVPCCHHLLERQAERTPESIAVRCHAVALTYRELNEQANQLAHLLMRHGVGPGVPVGLCLERHARMVVGILGILKAGGCYVPLDSHYPEERIQYMVHDSGIRLAVTDALSASALSFDQEIELVWLDRLDDAEATVSRDNPASRAGTDDTAYIMYTSGTSGTPKGIMVPHRGVTNLAASAADAYGVTERDRILQFFSVSFDGSVEEIFMTLAVGATLVIRTFDPAITVPDFLSFIEKNRISVIDLPTAYWKELVHGVSIATTRLPDTLGTVIIGGEQASAADFRTWQQVCGKTIRLVNTYGPTECTVVSACCDPATITCAYDENRGLPIGKAVANTQLFIVDEKVRRVPFGMPGELLIGGLGVAKGYINLPESSAEHFIDNLFHENPTENRLYRTGDIVRALPDGNLQYLGRKDNQLKIRGFRIEPGEIESVLNQHEQIKQSVVIDLKTDQGKTVLAAYFVAENHNPPSSGLRRYLAQKMPEYMVPSHFIPIDRIPLLPNGKIDRSSLPMPDPDVVAERTRPCVAPGTDIEKALVETWQEVLGVHPIGITDDFFELGGHSILAVRLCSQIQKKINRKVTLSGLFQSLTIEKLARRISDEEWVTEHSPAVCIHSVDSGVSFPTLFFIHILGTGLKFCRPLARHLSPGLPVYGLSIHLLEEYPTKGFCVKEVAERYVQEVKRIQPEGPYLLAGISFGGIIAFEMARELDRRGEKIGLIALIDTNLPGAFQFQSGKEKMRQHRNKLRQEGASYLIRKTKEKLKYTRLDIKEQYNTLYSRILLGFYNTVMPGTRRLPVYLKEFTANIQNEEALRLYEPHPFDGRVTLFKSQERLYGDLASLDPQFGWGAIALGGVEVIDCPGDHFSILAEPDVRTLAMKLMHSIEKSLHKERPVSEESKGKIVIRAAEKGDSRLFRDISLHSIRESPDAFVATLDQVQHEPLAYWEQLLHFIVDSPLDKMFLAFEGRRCIGFAAARIDSNDPAISRLRWMWVDRDFRGKRLGSRLLDTIIEWAESRGSRQMELWVSESQTAAIRLYESKGFADTGERDRLRPGSTIRARKMIRENPDHA